MQFKEIGKIASREYNLNGIEEVIAHAHTYNLIECQQ